MFLQLIMMSQELSIFYTLQKSYPFHRTDSLIIQLYQLKLQIKQFYLSVLLEKEPLKRTLLIKKCPK